MNTLDYCVLFAGVFWGVMESISAMFNRRNIRGDLDKVNYKFILIVSYAGFTSGIFLGIVSKVNNFSLLYYPSTLISEVGLFLLLLGIIIRWYSIFTLRKYFTINVTIQDDHKLIQSGLFQYIRHPAYLGGILASFGLGICYTNWASFILIFSPFTIAILKRIPSEEKILEEHFQYDYLEYKKRTRKLIPFVY